MILPAILGFIGGIYIGSIFHITLLIFLWIFLALLALAGLAFAKKKSFIASVAIFAALLGIVRINFSNLYQYSRLDSFAGKKISAEGIIVVEPDMRETNTKLTIRLDKPLREKILVTTNLYPEFRYGDKVQMDLVLEKPKNIESEDGRIFDYEGYLRVRGIWYTSKFTKVALISSGHGSVIKTALFKIKHSFTDALNRALPEPESSLMAGLLLGAKQSLGKELLLEFQRTGVSHVVVLSGYNIAIVATSIMSLLSFLPKSLSFGFGIISIVLFTILSGGGASAWRAAIMVLVALIAKKWNREYKAHRAFGFAIILMLAPNPLLLVFDPSFQLSALATIGIIFVSPIITPYFSKITEKFGLREIISSTIATQLTVLPFLLYTNGLLSFVSLPVNVLILGTVPITMFFGFVTGMVGIISLWLSFIPAFFAYILLWYQLTIVHIGATASFGVVALPAFSPAILVLAYILIFVWLYFLKKRKSLSVLKAKRN